MPLKAWAPSWFPTKFLFQQCLPAQPHPGGPVAAGAPGLCYVLRVTWKPPLSEGWTRTSRQSLPKHSPIHSEAATKPRAGAACGALGPYGSIMTSCSFRPALPPLHRSLWERGSTAARSCTPELSRWRQNLLGLNAGWWQGARPPGT